MGEMGSGPIFPTLRRAEVEDRLGFVLRIRQSQEQAIRRLEGLPDERRASAEIRTDSGITEQLKIFESNQCK